MLQFKQNWNSVPNLKIYELSWEKVICHKSAQKIYAFLLTGSLVAEISALRQHYTQTGGRDPQVIAQLNEMLKDAEKLESAQLSRSTNRTPGRPNYRPRSEELVAMELENYRLQRELVQRQTGAIVDPRMYHWQWQPLLLSILKC